MWQTLGMITSGLAAFMGCIMLRRGWQGFRAGDDPHCGRCDYNLTGIDSENCPECGTELSDGTVVLGVRRRRRGMVSGGAALTTIGLLGASLGLLSATGRVDWHRHMPMGILVRFAEGDDSPAVAELLRRVASGDVDEAAAAPISALAVAKFAQAEDPPDLKRWSDILGHLHCANLLSEAQRETYYQNVLRFRLELRERVRNTETLVYMLWHTDRGSPVCPLDFEFEARKLFVGSDLAFSPRIVRSGALTGRGTAGQGSRDRVFDRNVGVHAVRFPVSLRLFDPSDQSGDRAPLWSSVIALESTVETIAMDAPHPIELVDDPELGERLKQLIEVSEISPSPSLVAPNDRARQGVQIKALGPMPIDVAFEVSATDGRRRVRLGAFKAEQGEVPGTAWLRGVLPKHLPPAPLSVVLRGSRETAAESLGCYRIWSGELLYRPGELADR